jgi:hypothetical protein
VRIDTPKGVEALGEQRLSYVGSQTFWRAHSVQHTPCFPGNFFWSRFFSPHVVQQHTRLTVTHDPAIALSIRAGGMTGGAVAALASDAPDTVRHEYAFKQGTA